MKRILKVFLCVMALTAMMTVSAFAAEASVSSTRTDVTITPYTADGVRIELSEDGTYADPAYYSLTCTSNLIGTGGQYVVLMVEADLSGDTPAYTITEDSLIYINQNESQEGSVSFDKVYPSRLTDSVLILSGEAFTTNPVVVGTVEVAEEGLLGDVDGNNVVNVIDAQTTLRSSVGMITFSDSQKKLADVDGNEVVNVVDAQWILRYSVGLVTEFPRG